MNIKNASEIAHMTHAGKILGAMLAMLVKEVKIGIATSFLDEKAREFIDQNGVESAFLGYRPHGSARPYPAVLCVSVNDTVVHGLPSRYVIQSGDIIKIDAGVRYRGLCVDAARTVGVGVLTLRAQRLIDSTKEALHLAIQEAVPGNTVGDIGYAVKNFIEQNKFSVVRELTGHGIGRELHEDPSVPNWGKRGKGEELVPGMTLAIEPMVSIGGGDIIQQKDDSFKTADQSLSAHFEHTVLITDHEPKILTKHIK